MKNKKKEPLKKLNTIHEQIHCKAKELDKNIEINYNEIKYSALENNKLKKSSLLKRNSLQSNQKIILKPINKKIESLKGSVNIKTSNQNISKIYKSGKNPTKIINHKNSSKIRNVKDKKRIQLDCSEVARTKSLSGKLEVNINFEGDENNNNNICVYKKYKDDKINIIYNSTNNNIYSSATQKGFLIKNNNKSEKENNQDVSLILEDVCGIKKYNIYCIMDGHGSNGHYVSNYIKEKIIQNFNNISFYFRKITNNIDTTEYPENILELIKHKLTNNNFKKIKDFYNSLNEGLSAKEILFDIHFSGSTCIILFQLDTYLICSNVGDSRAIMIKENLEIVELSLDQKPENENEKKRIENMGGIISQCNDLYDDGKVGGPFRIWVKGCDYPGIAMSRSIGDKIAHDIGVISEPEILNFNIDDKCICLIIGSDGVWQYLKNEDVAEIIEPFLDGKKADIASKEIIRKSSLSWIENDSNVDDITVSVIFLKM